MEAKIMMKSLEKPSKASLGVNTLVKQSIARINIVTTSTLATSVANSIMAKTSKPKTMAIPIN
jgi:hypothetical protein